MQLTCNILFLFLTGILINIVFAKEGVLLGALNHKPDGVASPNGPDESQDGCPRKYPLTPKNAQEVPYAFKRYGIVPDLLAKPPTAIVQVCVFGSTLRNYCIQ